MVVADVLASAHRRAADMELAMASMDQHRLCSVKSTQRHKQQQQEKMKKEKSQLPGPALPGQRALCDQARPGPVHLCTMAR